MQSVHYPVQVPEKYTKDFGHIKDKTRRTYYGMVKAMDESVAKVVSEFEKMGQLENTIIVFTSDNGGRHDFGGINYPLRGEKRNIWQGGVRTHGFITGPGVERGSVNQLFHASDWFPTILKFAECETHANIDGVDQSAVFSSSENIQKRKEVLVNIDPIIQSKEKDSRSWIKTSFDTRWTAAIIVDNWKLITGNPGPDKVYDPPELSKLKIFERLKRFSQNETRSVFLYDLAEDPTESHDLSDSEQTIVNKLLEKLENYTEKMLPPQNSPGWDADADPTKHGGYWDAWK